MTIDEAIAKYKEITNTDENCPIHCMRSCNKCVQESGQLVEWLELLKWYEQDMEDIPSESGVLPKDVYHAGYRKAIDDFVERLTTYLGIENATKYGNKNAEQMRNSYGTFMNYEIAKSIEDVAEQLKAGGTDAEH